ncbi:MAG: RNA polymerase sigma factor [Myxococcota bacterium]
MSAGLDLAAVYRMHHDLVWRSLRALGVDAAMADDATQDVFMVVHRRLHDYDGTTPVRRWVLGIARNVAFKYRERSLRSAARVRPLDGEDERAPAPLTVVDDPAEDVIARREAAAVVERFVERLDPNKRAVFMLCEIEGFSAPEVSAALGIKLNTVYSRLRVAREKFEQAIARHQATTRRKARAP